MRKNARVRVMFTAGNGWTSRPIEWFGGGGWSHAASVLADGSIIDARSDVVTYKGQRFKPGVQLRPAHYLDSEPRWIEVEIPCTREHARKRDELLHSQLKKPYDFPGIWDFVDGSYRDRNWRDESAWFCSELETWALEMSGICPALTAPVCKITPGDALLIAQAAGGRVVAYRGLRKPIVEAPESEVKVFRSTPAKSAAGLEEIRFSSKSFTAMAMRA